MNINQALAAEHSIKTTNAIVDYIGTDAARFNELVEIFLGGEYCPSQRAAWPLSYCVQIHPEIVQPHLNKLIDQLERDDVHDAVTRNVARLLQYTDIPEDLKGRILDLCFMIVDDPQKPVAARVYAMTTAARIAHDQPDLMRELRLIVDKHAEHTSVAFRKRAEIVLGA
jgi:hypothetical protein